MTTLDDFMAAIGYDDPHHKDEEGRLPLHHAIQQSKDDPTLLRVIEELIAVMSPEDTTCTTHYTCSNRSPR